MILCWTSCQPPAIRRSRRRQTQRATENQHAKMSNPKNKSLDPKNIEYPIGPPKFNIVQPVSFDVPCRCAMTSRPPPCCSPWWSELLRSGAGFLSQIIGYWPTLDLHYTPRINRFHVNRSTMGYVLLFWKPRRTSTIICVVFSFSFSFSFLFPSSSSASSVLLLLLLLLLLLTPSFPTCTPFTAWASL